jgi:hypothetical protein
MNPTREQFRAIILPFSVGHFFNTYRLEWKYYFSPVFSRNSPKRFSTVTGRDFGKTCEGKGISGRVTVV